MGVEYSHFLIPRPNSFFPESEALLKLLQELTAGKWLPLPESGILPQIKVIDNSPPPEEPQQKLSLSQRVMRSVFRRFTPTKPSPRRVYQEAPATFTKTWLAEKIENDLYLEWTIENLQESGLRYPLERLDHPPDLTYYCIRFMQAFDYIHRTSDCIEGLDNVCCSCGEDLQYFPETDIYYASRLHFICPACGREFDPSDIPATVLDAWSGEPRTIPGGATSRFAMEIDCGKCIPDKCNANIAPDLLSLCERVLGCTFYQVGSVF